jgi:TRAP transporter TAXI family solute receptor
MLIFSGFYILNNQSITAKSKGKSSSKGKQKEEYTFSSGFSGGTYHKFAETMNGLAKVKYSIIPSSGSLENIERIRQGKADLALCQLDIYTSLAEKDSGLANKVKLALPLYKEELHILVTQSYNDLTGLKGKTVSIGPELSGTSMTAQILFKSFGFEDDYFQIDRSSPKDALNTLVTSEKISALLIVAGAPVEFLSKAESGKLQLLQLSNVLLDKLDKKAHSYGRTVLPKGTYPWQTKDNKTLYIISSLIVKSSIKDSVIKKFIKSIFKNQKKLVKKHKKWTELSMKKANFVNLVYGQLMHPGAAKALDSL